jgi:hypothetical protein
MSTANKSRTALLYSHGSADEYGSARIGIEPGRAIQRAFEPSDKGRTSGASGWGAFGGGI